MNEDNFIELGKATNFAVAENQEEPGTFWLTFHSRKGGEETYLMTTSLAKFLWFKLTRILFPQADQIVARAPTAALGTVSSMSVLFTGEVWVRKDGLVEITAMSVTGGWSIRVTPKESRELWSCLDQALEAAGEKEEP